MHMETILLPPLVFLGLLAALWSFKCAMMVICQGKIIYMPFLPPNARHEKIEDYADYCQGVEWKKCHIRSEDGTRLALAVASLTSQKMPDESGNEQYILYFQGQ